MTHYRSVTLEDESEIKFDPLRAILGTPFDAKCLKGVTDPKNIKRKALKAVTLNDARVVGIDAVVDGYSNLHHSEGFLSANLLNQHAERIANLRYGYLIKQADDLTALYSTRHREKPLDIFNGTALFISTVEPDNFGSFILRVLPQLVHIKNIPEKFDLIIAPHRTIWLHEVLVFLGLANLPILTAFEATAYRFRRLLKLENFYAGGAISASTSSLLLDFGESFTARNAKSVEVADRPSRLYLSRRLQSFSRPAYRPLKNEPDIELYLEKYGFTKIHPETLTFKEQIALFRSAKIVCGPSGSGMMLNAFSEPESKVIDLESYTETVRQHAYLYSTTHKYYAFCFGQLDSSISSNPIRREWQLPLEALEESLSVLGVE